MAFNPKKFIFQAAVLHRLIIPEPAAARGRTSWIVCCSLAILCLVQTAITTKFLIQKYMDLYRSAFAVIDALIASSMIAILAWQRKKNVRVKRVCEEPCSMLRTSAAVPFTC
ncbi:hypothetical protein EJ04DRAFT_529874 [Polyplosphaeria fusca]|uniref:Uncharacterized protein n=1 Tax=Polyplosphaeria fusca TaxID=682080 RepID=A0A9P4USM7_9PLEO|nr:hypothetical protein EJ04DRAFT_529874 [Polyplosphaeria fusca]